MSSFVEGGVTTSPVMIADGTEGALQNQDLKGSQPRTGVSHYYDFGFDIPEPFASSSSGTTGSADRTPGLSSLSNLIGGEMNPGQSHLQLLGHPSAALHPPVYNPVPEYSSVSSNLQAGPTPGNPPAPVPISDEELSLVTMMYCEVEVFQKKNKELTEALEASQGRFQNMKGLMESAFQGQINLQMKLFEETVTEKLASVVELQEETEKTFHSRFADFRKKLAEVSGQLNETVAVLRSSPPSGGSIQEDKSDQIQKVEELEGKARLLNKTVERLGRELSRKLAELEEQRKEQADKVKKDKVPVASTSSGGKDDINPRKRPSEGSGSEDQEEDVTNDDRQDTSDSSKVITDLCSSLEETTMDYEEAIRATSACLLDSPPEGEKRKSTRTKRQRYH